MKEPMPCSLLFPFVPKRGTLCSLVHEIHFLEPLPPCSRGARVAPAAQVCICVYVCVRACVLRWDPKSKNVFNAFKNSGRLDAETFLWFPFFPLLRRLLQPI
jgi:hypothetical protein